MEHDEVIKDYQERCESLHGRLTMCMMFEDSSRVWVAVLTNIIATLSKQEENPEGCIEQAINALRINFIRKEE